jgi:hypothetical protein
LILLANPSQYLVCGRKREQAEDALMEELSTFLSAALAQQFKLDGIGINLII